MANEIKNDTNLYKALTGIVYGYTNVFNLVSSFLTSASVDNSTVWKLDATKLYNQIPSSCIPAFCDDIVYLSGQPTSSLVPNPEEQKYYIVSNEESVYNNNVFRYANKTWINMTNATANMFNTNENIRFIIPDTISDDKYLNLKLNFYDNNVLTGDATTYSLKLNSDKFIIYDVLSDNSLSAILPSAFSNGIPHTYNGKIISFTPPKNTKSKYLTFEWVWESVQNSSLTGSFGNQFGSLNGTFCLNSNNTPDTLSPLSQDIESVQDDGTIKVTEFPKYLKLNNGKFYYIPGQYITQDGQNNCYNIDISQALAVNNLSSFLATWTVYF